MENSNRAVNILLVSGMFFLITRHFYYSNKNNTQFSWWTAITILITWEGIIRYLQFEILFGETLIY